jgi:catechol 2,3-dioxygenase-like lactoylglutathione lyase family enzyme
VLYVCYFVFDIERALAFYVGLLGMKEQLRIPLGKGLYEAVLAFPEAKGSGVILMWNTERTVPHTHGDAYNRLVLRVSDVDGATRVLREASVPVVTEPTDAPGLRYSMVRDPDGYVVELLQLKRG